MYQPNLGITPGTAAGCRSAVALSRVTELLDSGQDPTVSDSEGRSPYAVAANKGVRDAFRRQMGLNPDQWDWAAAGVPTALTPELEARQAAKQVCTASWHAVPRC